MEHQGTLLGLGTLFAFIAFVGVCIWAWSDKRKQSFEEAANLPFADDDELNRNDKGNTNDQ